MKNYIILLIVVFILAGCTSKTKQTATPPTISKPVNSVVTSNECSTINSLVTGYESEFDSIKTDKVSYQCQTPIKTQTHAVKSHQTLAKQLRQCLSKTGWFESQKETASSIYSSFVLDTKNPVITLSTIQEGNGFSTRFEIAPPLGF